jgi:Spy/CpxP family protein refolding chaperone
MKTFFAVGLAGMSALGMTGIAIAQGNAPQSQDPNQARAGIHGPRSIDQELDHLTKDLELTANQRKQVRPLLDEHHDKIQALFDNNPKLSRRDLGPQIHAISDETHHQIEALLTEHQKQLAKAMQERMRNGEESRRPVPPTESK